MSLIAGEAAPSAVIGNNHWRLMPFADPTAYSKGQINRAGAEVRLGNPSDAALEIINNWRASHAYILNIL